MTAYMDKLNLRPFEKRLVFGVGSVLFVVLNLWLVVPYFSEWGRVQIRFGNAQRTLAAFNREINDAPRIKRLIAELQGEGLSVPPEDQIIQLQSTIQQQAAVSLVTVVSMTRPQTTTNQFFIEQSQTANLESGESQLVDFLYNLGVGNSLIRVRDLNIRPNATRQLLSASVKLVASYQKKATTPAPTAAAAPARLPSKAPAPAPAAQTNATGTPAPKPAPPAKDKPKAPALTNKVSAVTNKPAPSNVKKP